MPKVVFFLVVLLIALLAVVASAAGPHRKRLAGPPEEFALHRVPNPADVLLTERSITHNIYFEKGQDGTFSDDISIPVDGRAEFYFTLASPYADNMVFKLKDPRGKDVDVDKAEIEVPQSTFAIFFHGSFQYK